MRHIISAIVENKPGVLAHIAGLFAGRGFNIDSLAVGETEDPTRSRMTVVVRGDDAVLEQVRKQLGKIVDVIKVSDFSGEDIVERDLMLIKVGVRPEKRGEVFEVASVFRGKIVDIGAKHLTIEIAGPEKKIEAFIDLLKPYGIKELARTGRIALGRGSQ
jgi:acetolactate synthase-1/3 small subunit